MMMESATDVVTEAIADRAFDAPSVSTPASSPPVDADLVTADLLVEDVSIDGMCGVY
jgi:mycofactocin precursor